MPLYPGGGVYPGAGVYPAGGAWAGIETERVFNVRSTSRLAVTVTHATNLSTRWGFDEDDPANIPTGISFSTSVPGGFKTATLTLPRRIDKDYPDLNLYDDIKIYAPGGQTVFEGRITQLPLQHDSSYSVTVGAVGHAVHLTDDPTFSMIYVDRDLAGWGDMASARRLAVIAVPYTLGGMSSTPDTATGLPAIVTTITGNWAVKAAIEAWYDAGPGNLIGAIYYDFVPNANVGTGDANWDWHVSVSPDDTATSLISTANLRAASGAGYHTPASAYRYGLLSQVYAIALASGFDNVPFDVLWRKLAVYGAHGLTRHGTDPGGFYASDVIADIVERAAPLLNYTLGTSIERTSFIIPHLVFRDPTTAENAISLVNGYHLYEWGVWEDRTFYWRQPSADRLTWQARLSEGAKVALEGDDANNVFNGVLVQYTDGAGVSHTVGPPGSYAETTSALLADTSSANPINAHGIPRRWGLLNISQPTSQAAAIQLGSVWLAEHSLPQRRGTITLTGEATHPTKGARPVFEMRAGDWITIADRQGDVARRIIETSYSHDSRTVQLSLDNTTFKLEAILERLGVSVVGVL